MKISIQFISLDSPGPRCENFREVSKMNKTQLCVMWLAGLVISASLFQSGSKQLVHAASNPETLATGYPFTLLAGTVWSYVLPVVIIGALLMVTFKDHGK
jgi:hypothetical protein